MCVWSIQDGEEEEVWNYWPPPPLSFFLASLHLHEYGRNGYLYPPTNRGSSAHCMIERGARKTAVCANVRESREKWNTLLEKTILAFLGSLRLVALQTDLVDFRFSRNVR